MKRYMAFCGAHYYPAGGMGDFVGDFDTIEEADEATTKALLELDIGGSGQWAEVFDTLTMQDATPK